MNKIRQKALSRWKHLQRANSILLKNKSNKALFFTGFLLSCVVTQIWALDSWLFGQLTNKLVGQASIFAGVSLLVAVTINFGIDTIPRSLKFIVKRLELKFRKLSTEETQRMYWNAYAKFDVQDKEDPKLQDALNNASRNQDAMQELFFIQWTLSISVLTVIVSAFMLATVTWWYCIVVILMILPRMYFVRKRKIRNYVQEKQLNEVRRYKDSLSTYISTKDSILNNSRSFYLELFNSVRSRLNLFNYKSNEHFSWIAYVGDIWYFVLLAGLLLSVMTQISNHEIAVGTMFVVFGSINRMYTELDQSTNSLVDLEIASKKAEDFFLILDTLPAIIDAPNAISIDNTIAPTIEFDCVDFKYPGTEKYVLRNVMFKIHAGETVGLIGRNGEGKSTIALLLLRFYDVSGGSIRINGTDIRLINRQSLLSITGVLFQDFITLKTTIKSAILACDPYKRRTDFELWHLLETVGLRSYVETLPYKLNQKVDRIFKDSVKLSGGQNQKLGLAGLAHRDPKLIILDEFTSALDPEAEQEIVRHYKSVIKGKTSLIISHRYLSLNLVDKILVLENGVIVESGKKEELLLIENGAFRKLYTAAQLAITHLN